MFINLILPQSRLNELHFSHTVYAISILLGRVSCESWQKLLKITKLQLTWVQGHSRSSNATFYWWLIVTSAVSRTVSELRRLIGQKSTLGHTLSHLMHSRGVILCEYDEQPYIAKKLYTLCYLHCATFVRFDTTPACDGQTDGQKCYS